MLEVGAGGEMLVARLRLVVSVLLILMPALNYWGNGDAYESLVGLSGVGAGDAAQPGLAEPRAPASAASLAALRVLGLRRQPGDPGADDAGDALAGGGAQFGGRLVLLSDRDLRHRAAQRSAGDAVHRRAGDPGVPGADGVLPDDRGRPAGVGRLRHRAGVEPAAARDPARRRDPGHRDPGPAHAQAGAAVGHRRPDRPAQPHAISTTACRRSSPMPAAKGTRSAWP